MNDEELYVLATQELNSNQRREDLWARAIALASDDHDEARYLYTNLRVEELAEERRAEQLRESQAAAGDSASSPSSVPGHAAVEKIPEDEVLRLEDLPDAIEHKDPIPTTNEHGTDRSIYDQTRSNYEASLSENNNRDDDPEVPRRITNQMGIYVDNMVDGEDFDPLDRTEPDGFAHADNSMELTAPENLPPVRLHPDEPEVEVPVPIATAAEPAKPVTTSSQVDDSADISEEDYATELTSGRAYTVLQHGDGSRKAVKIGNSWPALLLTLPWLLYKKLWGTALVYFIMAALLICATVVTGLSVFDAGTDASAQQKLIFAAFLLLSFFGMIYIPFRQGNDWSLKSLQRKGYRHTADINAQSGKDALDLTRH